MYRQEAECGRSNAAQRRVGAEEANGREVGRRQMQLRRRRIRFGSAGTICVRDSARILAKVPAVAHIVQSIQATATIHCTSTTLT